MITVDEPVVITVDESVIIMVDEPVVIPVAIITEHIHYCD